jgi:hypothetical protein
MRRQSIRHQSRLATLALALSLVLIPGNAFADGWVDDQAADATAGDISDHEEGSDDPDLMTTGSHDPDAMTVDAGTMSTRMADSEDPDAMTTGVDAMDDVTGEGLTDLKTAKPDEGFIALEAPGQSEWQPTTNARILLARQNLLRAEARAEAARTAYGDMMESNYPRGQARIRIVNERDASLKAFEEAKRALAKAEAAVPAAY